MATFHVTLDYVTPATDLQWRFYKFVYLIDPICTGDVKVADIQYSPHTGQLFVHWDNVPRDSDWGAVHAFPTYGAAQRHIRQHVGEWFQQFARVPQPLSATH